MLNHLKVQNFAIIENLEVSFEPGMNVLTGETGAGKSLLIDAIGLLLGDRASSEVIRSGETYAEITAIFSPLNETIKESLTSLDIPFEDDELLIKRRIKSKGGNLIKANRETITLSDLRTLTQNLADIHTQQDTARLINPSTYLQLLDMFDPSIEQLKETYLSALNEYLNALKHHEQLKQDQSEMASKLAELEEESEELAAHNLIKGELSDIEARLNTLHNFDQLFHALKNAHELLEDSGSTDRIYEAASALETIEAIDEDYQSLKTRTESAYYELDDIRAVLSDTLQGLDFDPEELEQLENRKHALDTLRRKYNMDIEELIEYHEQINEKLTGTFDYDALIKEAKDAVVSKHDSLVEAAQVLREKRKETALDIESTMQRELAALELKDAQFSVQFNDAKLDDPFDKSVFHHNGIDTIDFLLTTNAGEPLKPLKNVASGGEMSRIMLALKTLLVSHETINLMIFDEIDTGVSGYVASQVAKKMHAIGSSVQVLAITHLPQVAAKADNHYFIYKEKSDGRTITNVKLLSETERVDALAEMISSGRVTKSAKESAKELLQ